MQPDRGLVLSSIPGRTPSPNRLRSRIMPSMSEPVDKVAGRIADVAADCGITLVASLPDGWITPLITRFDRDARFRHVAVNREESAIGLCSGAFFGAVARPAS